MTGMVLAGKSVPGQIFTENWDTEAGSVKSLKVNFTQAEFPKSQKYEELIVKLVDIDQVGGTEGAKFLQICDIHDSCVLKIENDICLPRISVIYPNTVDQKDESFMITFQCEDNEDLDLTPFSIGVTIKTNSKTASKLVQAKPKMQESLSKTLTIPIKQSFIENPAETVEKLETEKLYAILTFSTNNNSGFKFQQEKEIKIEIKPCRFIRKIGFKQPRVTVHRTAEKINIPISMQPETATGSNIGVTGDNLLQSLIATGKLRLSNDVVLPLTSKNYLMVIKPIPRQDKEEFVDLVMQNISGLQMCKIVVFLVKSG